MVARRLVGDGGWCRCTDLNRGPIVYETIALPLSYTGDPCELFCRLAVSNANHHIDAGLLGALRQSGIDLH